VKIDERVHLLASGAQGVRMTHDLDCNVYLLNGGTEYALIDAGVGDSVQQVEAVMLADGLDPRKLRYILLTHGHLDHSGACHAIYERFRCQVICSDLTANALENGDEDAIHLRVAKEVGAYPAHYRLTPCPVKQRVADGDSFQVGDCHVTALLTPGHSKDMTSFLVRYNRRTLFFCGDTIFHGGKILLMNVADCSVQDYAGTIRRLGELRLEAFFPGHLLWVLRDGDSHIKTALSYMDKFLFPPNIL
jgi:glyoxylase-like metal-dependent hydrolase (beta-lactamase superfamily II)